MTRQVLGSLSPVHNDRVKDRAYTSFLIFISKKNAIFRDNCAIYFIKRNKLAQPTYTNIDFCTFDREKKKIRCHSMVVTIMVVYLCSSLSLNAMNDNFLLSPFE